MCSQYAPNWRGCMLTTAEMVSCVHVHYSCWFLFSNYPTPDIINLFQCNASNPSSHLPVILDMNSCLSEVLVKACVSPALLSERFAMLHAMVVAILHRNVGSEVGKFLVIQPLSLCTHIGWIVWVGFPVTSPLTILNAVISFELPVVPHSEGAHVIQVLAKKLSCLLSLPPSYGQGKECDCVLMLIGHLYNFKVWVYSLVATFCWTVCVCVLT